MIDNMTAAKARSVYRSDEELHDLIIALVVQHQLDLFGHCDSSSLLARLHDAAVIEHAARDGLASIVRGCRNHGATWDDIGKTLGITRQAAQQRFPTPDAPTARPSPVGQP